MRPSIELDIVDLKRYHLEWNILKDTLKRCMDRRILNSQPNEQFVAFLVKLHLLNPDWGITTEVMKSRDNIQKLVRHLVKVLESQHLPSVIALKMQFYYACSMEHLDSSVESNNERMAILLKPLRKNILSVPAREVYHDPPFFDRKVISYAVLFTGMGNPQEQKVYCEAWRVWRSLMDEKGLAEFLKKSREDRDKDLEDIVYLICGIRLYNKYSGKAEGSGIGDFPTLIAELIGTLRRNVEISIKSTNQLVTAVAAILDRFFVISTNSNDIKLVLDLPVDIKRREALALIDLLVVFRQHLIYLQKILQLLKAKERQADVMERAYKEKLYLLDNIIVGRYAVVATIAFPQLIDLAKSWLDLKNRLVPLVKLEEVTVVMGTLRKKAMSYSKILEKLRAEIYSTTTSMVSVPNIEVKQSVQDSDNCIRPRLKSMNLDVVVHSQRSVCETTAIEYNGYCIFKLVETEGALLFGDQSLGLATHLGKIYAFSSPEACLAFSKNPSRYINGVIHLIRTSPYLIEILGMRDYLEEIREVEVIVEDKPIRAKTFSVGTQCEDEYENIIEPIKDVEYHWNIWELKLQALQLGYLTNCVTTSTQSTQTHTVTASRTQTRLTKHKDTQTKKDNYANTPKPSRFIAGLRKADAKKWFDVDLTRPVKE